MCHIALEALNIKRIKLVTCCLLYLLSAALQRHFLLLQLILQLLLHLGQEVLGDLGLTDRPHFLLLAEDLPGFDIFLEGVVPEKLVFFAGVVGAAKVSGFGPNVERKDSRGGFVGFCAVPFAFFNREVVE